MKVVISKTFVRKMTFSPTRSPTRGKIIYTIHNRSISVKEI